MIRNIKMLVAGIFVCAMAVSAMAAESPFGEYSEFTTWKPVGTAVERSDQHVTSGKYSTKLSFMAGNMYPSVGLFNNEMRRLLDLSDAKTLSFDCFNAGAGTSITLKVDTKGPKQYKSASTSFKVPAGQSTVTIDLSGLKKRVDMGFVAYFKLFAYKPSNDIVLYVDNLMVDGVAGVEPPATGSAVIYAPPVAASRILAKFDPNAPEFDVKILGDMEKPTKDEWVSASNPLYLNNGTVTLAAAGNEVIGFQVLLQSKTKRENMRVEFAQFDSKVQPVVDLFLQYYHFVADGSYSWGPGGKGILPDKKYYPDALIPFVDPYDEKHPEVAQGFKIKPIYGANQAVWIDIFVPKNMPAGKWKSTLTIKDNGKVVKSFPVVLTVYGFSLPDEMHVEAYGELYREKGIMLDAGVKFKQDPERGWKIYKEYLQMAHAHRFLALMRPGTGPGPRTKNGEYSYTKKAWEDFGWWDKYYVPVIDGSLFTAEEGYVGPCVGTGPSFFLAPFRERWYGSAKMKEYLDKNDGKIAAEDKKYTADRANEFWAYAKKRGLDKKVKFYTYIMDEVDGGNDIGESSDLSLNQKNVRETDVPFHNFMRDLQEALDKGTGGKNINMIWTSHSNAGSWKGTDADLSPYIRMWVPNAHAYDVEFYNGIRKTKPKDNTWVYHSGQPCIGNHTVNQTGIDLRTWGTLCWKYDIDGSFWWSMMLFGDKSDIYNRPIYKDGDSRWGNGVLFYPGNKLDTIGFAKVDGPVSCLRMKAYRRGLQDYEYLWLLSEKDGNKNRADKLLNEVLYSGFSEAKAKKSDGKGDWSTKPEDWNMFIRKVAESIEGTAKK